MPKIKTNRAAAKRFKRTGTGKFVFKKSHGNHILTKKTMASLSVPASSYHPAAVKFYNEKGIKITGFDQ